MFYPGSDFMSDFDLYVFFLCLIVFVLLTALFVYLIAVILKQTVRLIQAGLEDEAIQKAFYQNKRKKKAGRVLSSVVSTVFCAVMLGVFAFSMYVNICEDSFSADLPTLKVVTSSSMASKFKNNTYLFENGLNDQVERYDLLLTYSIPPENELELYDIVIYEIEGKMVLHRIIGIEEPNEAHPNERHFLLQGDALERPDRFPVLYSQMRGIYRGESVPFIGSFILFMQSPAGWLCILLVVFALIATPILEKHIRQQEEERLRIMGLTSEAEQDAAAVK
jgi:hypothetical protein